jgi:hypothetical protein
MVLKRADLILGLVPRFPYPAGRYGGGIVNGGGWGRHIYVSIVAVLCEIIKALFDIASFLPSRKMGGVFWGCGDNELPPPHASGMAGRDAHWLDRLEAGVKAHIEEVGRGRDELTGRARPPQMVLDVVLADLEAMKLGARLNKAYAAALRMCKGQYVSVLERAKAAAEGYLAHFPSEQSRVIWLGMLASVYGKEDGGADTAVWLADVKGGGDTVQLGIGDVSVVGLV